MSLFTPLMNDLTVLDQPSKTWIPTFCIRQPDKSGVVMKHVFRNNATHNALRKSKKAVTVLLPPPAFRAG